MKTFGLGFMNNKQKKPQGALLQEIDPTSPDWMGGLFLGSQLNPQLDSFFWGLKEALKASVSCLRKILGYQV
jgi:hypothetical protein